MSDSARSAAGMFRIRILFSAVQNRFPLTFSISGKRFFHSECPDVFCTFLIVICIVTFANA